MNIKYIRLTSIFLLVLGLAASNTALAQDMEIISADPASAEQGTIDLDVTIAGTGFDETVNEVKFLLHCGKKNCPDTGDIIVNEFTVDTSEAINANINISDTAQAASFDIAVSSTRGRGGKGTTFTGVNKFSVKVRPNQTVVPCDDFAPNGTCDCEFFHDPGTVIYTLLGDCKTSETLKLLGRSQIWGPSQTNWARLDVVNCDSSDSEVTDCFDENSTSFEGEFLGSTVIANTNHRAGVRFVNMRFEDADAVKGVGGVTRGCDLVNDDIQTAVSFVLHGGIEDPPTENSFLQIVDMSIDSHGDPLCNAVEIVRESAYTDNWLDGKDGKVRVESVEITDESYVLSGIRYEGMKPQNSLSPPMVFGNTIGAPACLGDDPLLDPGLATAIQFGPVLLSDSSDPSSQIAGIVEGNTIRMATSCGTLGGVGILVLGEPGDPIGDQTTAEVVKNDVSGAFFGVLVDDNVVDVNFSGNKLTGDDNDATFDIGIDSEAQCTRMKGKPNNIADYNTPIKDLGCP